MVQILPFVGWRYDLSQVGALSDVSVPPSVLVDEALQRTLYRQHPCNAVRLVINREEPGDASPQDCSVRADEFWRLWKREGVLLHEHDGAFYIIETTYQLSGEERTRWSVIARLGLPDAASETTNDLYSVVESDPSTIARATELRRICNASLVPAVALLADVTGEDSDPRSLSDHFEFVVRLVPPVECIEDNGTRHRMWPITDQTKKRELQARLGHFSVCFIGGSAEYHAAIATKDLDLSNDPNDPTKTVLTCLIPADDPGVDFLPHVLLQNVAATFSGSDAQTQLGTQLHCQPVGNEPTAGDDATELARLNSQQPCVAVGTPDGAWMIVSPHVTNEPMESGALVQQICSIIGQATSESGTAVTQCLPQNGADFGKFLQHSKSKGLLIVEPPETAADVAARGATAPKLREEALRLYPSIPTGLVFSLMGISRLP